MAPSPLSPDVRGTPAVSPLGRLVHAAVRGDHRAWEQLVRLAGPAVRRAAAGFQLSRADIDDVAQTTWLRAYDRLSTLRDPEAFIGWLVVAARREALRLFQRHTPEILTDDTSHFDARAGDGPEDPLIESERADAIHGAVDRLPEHQRRLLRWILEHPGTGYAEIAAGLEMPIGSIGPTRERALNRLRCDDALIAVTG
jgi:RNA polymerase sigma factor (sigma-70 family)